MADSRSFGSIRFFKTGCRVSCRVCNHSKHRSQGLHSLEVLQPKLRVTLTHDTRFRVRTHSRRCFWVHAQGIMALGLVHWKSGPCPQLRASCTSVGVGNPWNLPRAQKSCARGKIGPPAKVLKDLCTFLCTLLFVQETSCAVSSTVLTMRSRID